MTNKAKVKVTLIAGGVGGAKMAEGLYHLDNVALSIIGNIADDEAFHGLWVSPDIDTLTYTLSDVIDRDQGWGVADESHRTLETLSKLGDDTWMSLGDRDFGLHICRTHRRACGDRPTLIARDIAKSFGLTCDIVLPTDDTVQTRVRSDQGWLSFQEYFVKERCAPEVRELQYENIEKAQVTNEALEALGTADLIVIAPSNPLVSILPILKVPGVLEAIKASSAPKIGVSPIINGGVVKGPADRMLASLGYDATAFGVAQIYAGFLDGFVIDHADAQHVPAMRELGLNTHLDTILMKTREDKIRLAEQLLGLSGVLDSIDLVSEGGN
ncbi:2-phospho-L-lactate transferase [Pseudovibrio axinellae]|uniref:2-phospho-L-lactate transferase n=1 Tax=Pseudovibrio axinellae TaxID=989403 RepID=A0A161XCS4_9HYPH|nr:2-phospho-L-lactate transferase [Pseudovibrio axinellae]KZL12548.1 2-phospho-L-lactate transferase [Pseudovibrio axinellae]SEP67437.1 LPPG:FO 2-phospho-L-lactate transferase [Pseudovibrio axinellae]